MRRAIVLGAALLAVAVPAAMPACARGKAGVVGRTGGSAHISIAAAGDLVCSSHPSDDHTKCQYGITSDLAVDGGFRRILLPGDTQYDAGAYEDFVRYFDPTWGRVLDLLSPAPGNHEYGQDPTSQPSGYFRYFGKRVEGPGGLGYYSFDLPRGCRPGSDPVCWHVISLSSMLCFAPGGCEASADRAHRGTGERMYAWLKADLAAHPNSEYPCTIAFWHHPLFSFSTGSGATGTVRPLWELLYRAHADIVLNGHSHNYQRWAPQDPDGAAAPGRGIREFIVGTGGKSHYALESGPWPANLVTGQSDAFGLLKLTLYPSGYRWEWLGAAGQPGFTDTRATNVSCV